MKLIIFSICFFSLLNVSHSVETVGEKTTVQINQVNRSAKKAVNRTKEALCGKLTGDNKIQCLAKKAKNNLEEGTDVLKDKGSEIKNKLDTDK